MQRAGRRSVTRACKPTRRSRATPCGWDARTSMLLASQPCSSTLTPHYSSTCSSPLATATAASAPRSSRTCSPMRPTSRSCSPSRRRTASHSGGCSVYDQHPRPQERPTTCPSVATRTIRGESRAPDPAGGCRQRCRGVAAHPARARRRHVANATSERCGAFRVTARDNEAVAMQDRAGLQPASPAVAREELLDCPLEPLAFPFASLCAFCVAQASLSFAHRGPPRLWSPARCGASPSRS